MKRFFWSRFAPSLFSRLHDLEDPIWAEIFSIERLEQYAANLAGTQEIVPTVSAGVSLHTRLNENAALLRDAYRLLSEQSRDEQSVTPASEWFIDNFHIVDAQVRSIRRDLPSGFYRQLPKLSSGPMRGFPRVYGLAWAEIAHTDSRFEVETLLRFCNAYQRVKPLLIGELWAVSISLRIVLIENLRRLCANMIQRTDMRKRADQIADQLLDDASPATAASVLKSLESAALPTALAAQLFQRLRDSDPATTPALSWLHDQMRRQGTSAEEVVHQEHHNQGAVNVTVRNVITSLRTIANLDWPAFVESVSRIDAMLRADSDFASMDFATRDLYRHEIETLARGSTYDEIRVTRAVLERSRRAGVDPGFFLIGAGRPALETELAFRPTLAMRSARAARAAGLGGYLAGIAAFSLLMLAFPAFLQYRESGSVGLTLLMTMLALIPATDAAVAIVNFWVAHQCPATRLPALELLDGVPAELRTAVVVPVLLTSTAEIDDLIERLEVHFLASQDGDLRFALLTDWTDAHTEHAADDEALLARAARGIGELNHRYGPLDGQSRFFLFHRRRQWNPSQRRWMGWERKRGKLHEFNRLLRGATDTSFIATAANPPLAPSGVRYVITLDADTRLPRGTARDLIGKMAHPLNRPRLTPDGGRVVAGYAVMQPRVTPSLPATGTGSRFQRIFSGPSGIDPYAFAVSDVYQDLLDEGSFSGKGIYEVDAFEEALRDRVPENRLLSHDLFEGTFARCGLVSDVELVEDYPQRYEVAAAREHRWIRGDWQLLPWILGFARSPLPALGRWKMIDNLRRSLIAPTAFTTLVLGWFQPLWMFWSAVILCMIALPVLLPLVESAVPGSEDSVQSYGRRLRRDLALSLEQLSLRFAFLADQAWLALDAIVRTLIRLCVTRRNLLEWTTAAALEARAAGRRIALTGRMAGGVLLTLVAILSLILFDVQRPWIAAPFLLAWLSAPLIARFVSRTRKPASAGAISADDERELRSIARQTWSYFDTFVTARHNFLPPDNFQEIPAPVVATRTSPTNIGLYGLSIAAARDFGWIGTLEALRRLEATLQTLSRMERYRGHFFNWYDTQDLRPLLPKYISAVDSGNLAGHLLALAGACNDWQTESPLNRRFARGILDTLSEVQAHAREFGREPRNSAIPRGEIEHALTALQTETQAVAARITAGSDGRNELAALRISAGHILDIAQTLDDARPVGTSGPATPPLDTPGVATPLLTWARSLCAGIDGHLEDACAEDPTAVRRRLSDLATLARTLAMAMDFSFLMDPVRKLLSIGYRVEERAQDPSCYDLLASEARLASFIGIAKGDLPVKHWFLLGRPMTDVGDSAALVSWSGSMFEYLMPALVMREPVGSLLHQTALAIVERQIEFGAGRQLPWGVSESAFNARDLEFTYQYSNFGVPGLGLKRGLRDEAVIAPYATALAAMYDTPAALANFRRIADLGGRGRHGWYEALDFTPLRVPEGQTVVTVRAYMAHHQGMVLLAMNEILNQATMRRRFHADPIVRATELLLQERVPRQRASTRLLADTHDAAPEISTAGSVSPRRFSSPHHVTPRTHLLSNGNYTLMITAAGSGYSRWKNLAVTRWREDPTADAWGSFVYLRDVGTGAIWSAGYQPVGSEPDSYKVAFFEDRAEFWREDHRISTHMEIAVSPEDDAEVRRISLCNNGTRIREIELTSYQELVLAPASADNAHPAFSKLFVHTEFMADSEILLATRRPREPTDPRIWAAHLCQVDGQQQGVQQFETDRAQFIGRGRDARRPIAITDARPLTDSAGTVLDPVFSLRRRVRLAPGDIARFTLWTVIAPSRDLALQLADKHRDAGAFDRVKTMAWTQAQVQLRYLGISFEEAQLFQRIANRILYADPVLRGPAEVLARNQDGPASLWTYGISGDLPIVLVRISDELELGVVKQLLRAHEYWHTKRLEIDIVILNDKPTTYASDLQQVLEAAARAAAARSGAPADERLGRVFALRADSIPARHRDLLQVAARVVFIARRGDLTSQVARVPEPQLPPARHASPAPFPSPSRPRALPDLDYFNGVGGFTKTGEEYVTILEDGQWTPAPWINVIANPHFGFQVSSSGAGNTWSLNARDYQLTPWSNDPVSETPGEAIYVKDEQSGEVWTPTALPIRESKAPYVIWHGPGYSRFEHTSREISLELLQFVPLQDSIKISRLKLTNRSNRVRQLSVTGYLDLVLGDTRARSAFYLITAVDARTGALTMRNPWNAAYPGRVSAFDMRGRQQSYTTDRAEFLGRHGTLAAPAALLRDVPLSNRSGAGLDPCAALQCPMTLRPGEEVELVFLLSDAASESEAVQLIERYRSLNIDEVLGSVVSYWRSLLGTVQVDVPDPAIGLLVNRWLLYQTLACRIWARSAFYQASGAFGFRDQLQDVLALCVAAPAIARTHIVSASGRQFEAGDVQHWWLPATGQGVRTRFADDRVWLPYVIAHYLDVTHDQSLLTERVPFLGGAELTGGQHESFFTPTVLAQSATVFEHAARALDSSLAMGQHGLPLFGGGDWNDGMNRVGAQGRGESVWLAWFLHTTLLKFASIADGCGEVERALRWRDHAFRLQQSIEREAWDGDWYRRGYYDDGSALGSFTSGECRIDSIAQSWGVISGGADPARALRAMRSVDAQLVSRGEALIRLFTPPFDHTPLDPGYIKAYPPGLRENGGQYTHAAVWTVLAFAQLGDGDRAAELFALINPIHHGSSRAGIHRYKVEPYVASADVYTAPGHVGRGGWTWYTGSAGWMYRTALEGMLGFHVRGNRLVMTPCIPRAWAGFSISYRHRSTMYDIRVQNPDHVNRGIRSATMDGQACARPEEGFELVDDGANHAIIVVLG